MLNTLHPPHTHRSRRNFTLKTQETVPKMVKEVMNAADFRSSLNVPNLVVVDYYATWCGPCKAIAPFVEQLSRRYPEVVFLKVGEHNCGVSNDLISYLINLDRM